VRIVAVLAAASLLTVSGCSGSPAQPTPNLVPRGTTVTTVKPVRQDLSNMLSLTGTVGLNPVFGIVAPVGGQVRYLGVATPTSTPTKPTRVANIYVGSKATPVEVPAGATFAGRLVDDRSTVTAGMPIVSARFVGYGIAASIDASDAYRVAGAPTPPADYTDHLQELYDADRRSDMLEYFLTAGVGQPQVAVDQMKQLPFWEGLAELGPTVLYDGLQLGGGQTPLPTELLRSIDVPVLSIASTSARRVSGTARASAMATRRLNCVIRRSPNCKCAS